MHKGWNVKRIIFGIILLFCFAIFNTYQNNKYKKDDLHYIQELNLHLKGKLTGFTPLSHNGAMANIEVAFTNLDSIDDRSKRSRYFIVLKKLKAELYIEDSPLLIKNDSIVVSDKIYIFRNNKEIAKREIAIPSHSSLGENTLMKEIRNAHKL